MPKLHFLQLEFTTHSCDLPEGTTKVGRSSRNNLVLSDASVSADHCDLVVSWKEVIARDHGSSNGTWVAGVRVNAGGQLPVNHGDLIRFGRVEARLELDGFPADDATSVTANFGASRPGEAGSDAKSFKQVIGSDPSGQDTRNPTVSVPAPSKPAPPAAVAPVQASVPEPSSRGGAGGRWWLKAAFIVVFVLALVWLLLMFP